jgi:subtilisin family serine protease
MKIFTKMVRVLVVAMVFVNLTMPYTAYSLGNQLSENDHQVVNIENIAEASEIKSEADILLSKGETNKDFQNFTNQLDNYKVQDNNKIRSTKLYVPDEVIVKFKDGTVVINETEGLNNVLEFGRENNVSVKQYLHVANFSLMKLQANESVEQAIVRLKKNPFVEYVQPNYQYYPLDIMSNDTLRAQLWALENIGQTINGTPNSGGVVAGSFDADIDAPEAWMISEGDPNVIVAVIDSGVAYNHPDLTTNMWDGSLCKDENGNSLGGCNHGYDFEDIDKTPLPTSDSHGTHIAGTIAAIKDNGMGIIGVAPHIKIMALKSGLTTTEIVAAINFAKYNGAKIINASWGGPANDLLLKNAIDNFSGLFIVAAMNNALNHSITPNYPCDFSSPNIICVAATDQNDNLADFSDYGVTSVDVGAPGVNILSTIADTVALNETFNSITPPAIPSAWSRGGVNNNWGTYAYDSNKVLYGYLYGSGTSWHNADSTVTSQSINLAGTSAKIEFITHCDTEYYDTPYDAMVLQLSSDGSSFTPIFWWDEYNTDNDRNSTNSAPIITVSYNIPSQYLTPNFKFQFRWITDSGNYPDQFYDGCFVDDIKVTKYSDGSDQRYDYYSGTSMATPHVAGLAGLLWSVNPALTSAEVKSTILNTGDPLASLNGKTVSGKRINASNALQSLSGGSISGTVYYYDNVKTVPGATVILENDIGTQLAVTTTTPAGFYQFTDLASGNYVVRVSKSDTLVSNGIDIFDLIKTRRHITEIEIFDSIFKKITADVNNDLSVDIFDLIKTRRYIAEIEPLPPVSWKFYSSEAILTTTNYLTTGLTRTFTNLVADALNQNFVGIKMGDVDNSWVNN